MACDCDDDAPMRECECGREDYCAACYRSCYWCYRERADRYVTCIWCGAWHSPAFDTCWDCRSGPRDEPPGDLRLVILGRDGFRCRYCGAAEGDEQYDPRLERPACPPYCDAEHSHRWPCPRGCEREHRHRKPGDDRTCPPGCYQPHQHLARDDDGIRPARLHIDHVLPCAKGGTADPWNLQVLCGVCNIAKGADWAPGSRHHNARRLLIAAYMTYLNDWLDDDQRDDLNADAAAEELTIDGARALIAADYARRVKAARRATAPRERSLMLTITDTLITSDETGATAEFREHAAADGRGAWVVFLPYLRTRLLDRNQAISALTAAEERARPDPDWLLIDSLESELL
jgi:5-methylcytosine-specific restriction endonuclease McrA